MREGDNPSRALIKERNFMKTTYLLKCQLSETKASAKAAEVVERAEVKVVKAEQAAVH